MMMTKKALPYRTVVRLPQSLAAALKAAAAVEGVSLNTLIIQRLAAEAKLDAAASELCEVIDEHLATLTAPHRELARKVVNALKGKEPHQC